MGEEKETVVDKVSQGVKDKYGIAEGNTVDSETMKKLNEDKDVKVTEKDGKTVIKESLKE